LIPNSIMSKKNDGFDFGIFGIKMTAVAGTEKIKTFRKFALRTEFFKKRLF
jgi:hypothetical protein